MMKCRLAMWTGAVIVVIACAGVSGDLESLRQYSLLYGIVELAGTGANTTKKNECLGHLENLKLGIDNKELWALKMLDASGSPGSGFLWGNNYWMGSLTQCRDLHDRSPLITAATLLQSYVPDPKSWPEFPVEFYVATFRHNTTRQVHIGSSNEDLISVGLCLPDVCSAQDISHLLRTLVARKPLLYQDLYDVDMRLELVRTLKEDNSWLKEPKFIVVAIIVLSTLLLMAAGTIYDTVYWQPCLQKLRRASAINNQVGTKLTDIVTNNNEQDNEKTNCDSIIAKLSEKPVQGRLARFLMCFSVNTNTGILLKTTISSESVGAIHGLRFMTMVWILMVHTLFYLSDYIDNKPLIKYVGTGFIKQVLSNGSLSVDTFFCISGFLVAYLFYQRQREKAPSTVTFRSKVKHFGLSVMQRFLRLTPAYMIVLGIVDINMSWHSRTSVFHMSERPHEVCSKFWWRNILYINNLFPRDEMCMWWSWYLSNDTQFFVIGMFLLILSTSFLALTVSILAVLLIGSSVITGFISYNHGYVPTLDQQYATIEILYDPPWTRIGPYLVGMVTGYLVVRLNGQLHLKKTTVAILWILGSACNVCALFGLYERNITPLAAAIYTALSRTAWGVGVSWIIVACCTNNAGFINRILSFPAWVPFSRLTYCAYLLNPLLMHSIYLSSETAQHAGFPSAITLFLGFLSVTYFCAYVVSLAFETPTILVMRQLINARSKDSST